MPTPILPDVPPGRFAARRRAAFAALGDGVMLLPSAGLRGAPQGTAVDLPLPPDRELYYLTGVTEPRALAVLVGGAEPSWTLFVPERDPEVELWSGPVLGPSEAAERFAPDECLPLGAIDERLPPLLRRADRIHVRLGAGGEVERAVLEALAHARGRGARTGTGPRGVVDPGFIVDELRVRKDEDEIELLRRAAVLTLEGHRAGASAIGEGVGEWRVEAAVNGVFRAGGGSGPGFPTIVGSGANGCILHYRRNGDLIDPGALVLVDAGAERALYHGDVTRTYPASGRFTPVQREVYDLVEAARAAAVSSVRPGVPVGRVHEVAARVLVRGLVGLGILRGDPEELLATAAHRPFYPHQTSHWLGLEVHDPGDYARNGMSRPLEPGMVITVEPGLYFRPGSEGPGIAFAGIGIRIEDDVLVTGAGHEVLSAALPTAADEVEALVGANA